MSSEDRVAFIEAQFLFVEVRNKVFDAVGHFVVKIDAIYVQQCQQQPVG